MSVAGNAIPPTIETGGKKNNDHKGGPRPVHRVRGVRGHVSHGRDQSPGQYRTGGRSEVHRVPGLQMNARWGPSAFSDTLQGTVGREGTRRTGLTDIPC